MRVGVQRFVRCGNCRVPLPALAHPPLRGVLPECEACRLDRLASPHVLDAPSPASARRDAVLPRRVTAAFNPWPLSPQDEPALEAPEPRCGCGEDACMSAHH